MQIPAKISFHNIDPSDALKARIEEKIHKLNTRYPSVVGCHVMVEAAHHHQQKGRLYSVRIDVTLPGKELVVSQHPGKNPKKHDKVFAAMNDAFSAIEKQLAKFNDQRKLDVKHHKSSLLTGVVSNYFPKDGYGFLATQEGREIYFHKNAVQNDAFDDLDIGTKVQFIIAKEEGQKGPQASLVKV